MAHHKHIHIKRESRAKEPFGKKELTREEMREMDEASLRLSLGLSPLTKEEKGAFELKIGQRILSYDPETNSGVLGCATRIDDKAWQQEAK